MPPRSFYSSPKTTDYLAFATAYFPEERAAAEDFAKRTGLPYVEASAHIAAYLGVSPSLIRQIIHKPGYHYREFELKKSNGGERLISTPKTYLKVTQWWILDNILRAAQLSAGVHGFRPGYSYVTNAKVHANARHILNVDIKSFFDSIRISQVANAFASLGYSEGGSLVLAALTTKDGAAPTGAPTSPMIANLILRDVDRALSDFAEANSLVYTRYADDLTFSGDDWIDDGAVVVISDIVGKAGFELNRNKTKFMGPGDRKEVTGVVVNDGLNAPREWRNWARGYLHSVAKAPKENIKEVGRVRGVYGILLQYDPDHNKPLTKVARDALAELAAASPSPPKQIDEGTHSR